MTEDEYLELTAFMIMEGYNAFADDDVLDAMVVKDCYKINYTDEQLQDMLYEYRNFQRSY